MWGTKTPRSVPCGNSLNKSTLSQSWYLSQKILQEIRCLLTHIVHAWWTCYNSTCSLTPGICPALWMLKSVGLLWKKPWGWNRCTSTPSPRSKDVSAVPLLPSPSDISIKVKTLSEREVNVVAMTPSKFSKLRLRKQERIPPNQQRLIRAEWFMQKSRSNWEGFEIIQDLEKEHNPFGLETER